jgi:hypothetical protein
MCLLLSRFLLASKPYQNHFTLLDYLTVYKMQNQNYSFWVSWSRRVPFLSIAESVVEISSSQEVAAKYKPDLTTRKQGKN